jgi:pyruvate kinase
VSKRRPAVPIIGLTTTETARRRTALMWGTEAALVPQKDTSMALIQAAEDVCLRGGHAQRGDHVVIVSGQPGGHGGTNRVLVHRLGDAPV